MQPLDYESQRVHPLTVISTDQGPGSIPSAVGLVVNVLDANDHAPIITLDSSSGDADHLAVFENQHALTLVAHLYVVDLDSGDNGDVICDCVSDYFRLEQLYSNMYKLITSRELDREAYDHHNVTLYCADHGTPSQQAETIVKVDVLDINDVTPRCDENVYFTNITEGNDLDVPLLRLTCSDGDAGDAGILEYTSESPIIHVSQDGEVTATMSFDYEAARQHQVRITITDRGDPQRFTRIHVIIQVTNINDQPPLFANAHYDVSIDENLPEYSLIGQFNAISLEPPPFNETRYFIDNQDAAWQMFDVNLLTGELYAAKSFDREASDMHNVTLLAVNAQNPDLRSSTHVTVHVRDVNDHAPVCVTSQNVSIPSDIRSGDAITTVQVVDLDDYPNAQHTYILENEEQNQQQGFGQPLTSNIFNIDLHTGIIVARDVDQLSGYIWLAINVKVTDVDLHNSSTTCTVYVTITEPAALVSPPAGSVNVMVIVIISCSTCFLIITLVAAILLVRRSQRRMTSQKYQGHSVHVNELGTGHLYAQDMEKFSDEKVRGTASKTCQIALYPWEHQLQLKCSVHNRL